MKENNFNLLQKILYGNLKKRSSTDNLLKNKKNFKIQYFLKSGQTIQNDDFDNNLFSGY